MRILCSSVLFFCVIRSLVCLNFHAGKQGKKQATFERFNNTCGERNLPIIFTYDSMQVEGNTLLMNSTINVKQDVLNEPKLTIELERCKNRENLDTCEHFYDYKSNKYCDIVEMNSSLWGSLYSSYVPKWKCPFRKGIYRATNSMMDMTAMLMFPAEAWFWKAHIKLNDKDTNRMISCLFVEAHIAVKP